MQELSKLLRYVLYDNQQMFVPLSKEIDFIRNYIELMRIRISAQVDIQTNFNIKPKSQTPHCSLDFYLTDRKCIQAWDFSRGAQLYKHLHFGR